MHHLPLGQVQVLQEEEDNLTMPPMTRLWSVMYNTQGCTRRGVSYLQLQDHGVLALFEGRDVQPPLILDESLLREDTTGQEE